MGILDDLYGFTPIGSASMQAKSPGDMSRMMARIPGFNDQTGFSPGLLGNIALGLISAGTTPQRVPQSSLNTILGGVAQGVTNYGNQLVANRQMQQQNLTNYLQMQKTGLEMQKLEQDVNRSRLFGEIASKMMRGDLTGDGGLGSLTAMAMLDQKNAPGNLIEIAKLRKEEEEKAQSLAGQLKPGEQKIDEKFSAEVVNFISSGAEGKIVKQMDVIKTTINELKNNPQKYYGSALNQIIAGTPIAKDFLTPELANLKETFDGAIQSALRSILGAAYTEQEGKDVLRRGFNVRLPPANNIARMERELKSLESQLADKKRSIEYFQDKGTLRGFQFVLPEEPEEEKITPNNNVTTNNSFKSPSGRIFTELR